MQTVITAIVPRRNLISDNYLIGLRTERRNSSDDQTVAVFLLSYLKKRESFANKKKAEKVLKRKRNFSSHFIEDKK